MTPLIRRYIKTSFVFLLAGLLIGAYIVVGQFVLDAYPPRLLITAHAHLLLVGFMPAVAHRAGWARPTRRNRSLRAEHVVARAHAPGGRAARPLRTRVGHVGRVPSTIHALRVRRFVALYISSRGTTAPDGPGMICLRGRAARRRGQPRSPMKADGRWLRRPPRR
jgi:hypothetical protein